MSSGNISVDGSEPIILSLRDLSRAQLPPLGDVAEGEPPTSLSRIRYALEGLQPGTHKLVVSPDDDARFVAFDALMCVSFLKPSGGEVLTKSNLGIPTISWTLMLFMTGTRICPRAGHDDVLRSASLEHLPERAISTEEQ